MRRALVSCGRCTLACTGRSAQRGYAYSRCRGKQHPLQSRQAGRCPARFIPAQQLDEVVWGNLGELLTHPQRSAQALERARAGHGLPQELQARREHLRRGHASLTAQLERLPAASLSGVSPLAEYQRRRCVLEHRQLHLERRDSELEAPVHQRQALAEQVASREAFCHRVPAGLAHATFEQRRPLGEWLIDRVVVTVGDVEIRYVFPTSPSSERLRFCHLRTDYFSQRAPVVVFERRCAVQTVVVAQAVSSACAPL